MAVTITQQNGYSNDLLGYFNSWSSNYTYYDHGFFNPASGGTYTQWGAGTEYDPTDPGDTPTSSVILNGDDFTYSTGRFSGEIESLNFGEGIHYDGGSSEYVQTDELLIDVSSVNVGSSSTFTYAIYVLSNYGSLESQTVFGTNFPGMYDFFAEQGTEQIGTAGADTQSSFGGDDTLTGGSGNDTFRFVLDDTGASAIGNDTITDFDAANEDIYIGLNDTAYDSYSEIINAASDTVDGAYIDLGGHGSITLAGVTVSELSTDNFVFA
ncbi:MAG: hypothetical protein CMH13_15320 [Martelella sp.]|uniref:hypothetical protein n=1 Tax=unclassified Martelella TaxID=2629616 RepID=UPI000C385B48|nr:hypothetical protein [Martelella sp.]MAU21880.1 hypothetical protein [Martelella sp.]